MNIKKYLKDVLSDAEIINLLPNKRIYFLHANSTSENPLKTPYIEYEIFDENGEDYAENKEIATNYYIQIDIFSKGDYTDLENLIKEKMLNAGFERSMCADLYEEDTQFYHKAMRFIFTSIN